MAPTRDKWVRRFIIPETTRHKKGFTIYKVTSVVFLKSSHEEISKISVWKRYNDFKKLHSELNVLYSESRIKESFPSFPKPKFFGRFEAEVIEERRECALKLLEFIGRHSCLYSSDIFIQFFETSHSDYCLNDCSQSLSSDTSAEDDRLSYINSLPNNDMPQNILQPKSLINSKTEIKQPQDAFQEWDIEQNDLQKYKSENVKTVMANSTCNNLFIENNTTQIPSEVGNNQLISSKNNNCDKDTNYNIKNAENSVITQKSDTDTNTDITIINDLNSPLTSHDGSDLPQTWPDSSQYILIAAAHMSAAFKHEDLTEYEEAFTQYKMGISSLRNGVESDPNKIRAEIIKEKISKYLQRAEKLYNRYLNCNISLLNKPVSELQYYKVLKIIKSVMLVKDVRQNCLNVVKAIEKLSSNKECINNYILRGQIPYMVHLQACVETESSVFLILQHLNRGKLWDFITSHYNSNNNKNCDKMVIKDDIRQSDEKDDILDKDDVGNKIEGTKLKKNFNHISTNIEVQMGMHPVTVEKNYENYSDVSTTQLLKKAHILLQSVNETLKESNSVVNRLCGSDHDHAMIQDNTSSSQIKSCLPTPINSNEVSVDTNDVSLEIDGISKNIVNEKIPEMNVITSKYLSHNDMKNSKGHCSSVKHPYSNMYSNLSFDERACSSVNNLEINNTHFATDISPNKNDSITKECELDGSMEISNKEKTNDYCISNDHEIRHNAHLVMSTKIHDTHTEQKLWTIPENVICLWAAEILLALEALHQQEVIVFDLKPDNILLDDDGHVQLTYVIPRHDIDLLKYEQPYSSPELCTFSPMIPLTPATDIWSFGVILYELIVGDKFQARHSSTFQQHSTINIPGKISENARSLLLNILRYEPSERLTIPEIKQHPFFKDVNWSSLVNPL